MPNIQWQPGTVQNTIHKFHALKHVFIKAINTYVGFGKILGYITDYSVQTIFKAHNDNLGCVAWHLNGRRPDTNCNKPAVAEIKTLEDHFEWEENHEYLKYTLVISNLMLRATMHNLIPLHIQNIFPLQQVLVVECIICSTLQCALQYRISFPPYTKYSTYRSFEYACKYGVQQSI